MAKSEPIDLSELPYHRRLNNITVDCFDIPIKNCSHYFLSHFHSDHYTKLSKSFPHLVYCSKTTAQLVSSRIGATAVGLEMYTTYDMGEFHVRLIEANHCPGAVLFIFAFGKDYYLHTGDFRYHPFYHNFKIPFKAIYLDNTYESFLRLPTQKEAISKVLKVFDQSGKLCPMNICVLCCTYLVGKEKVFLSVAEYLNKKVQVTEDKMAIYRCYDKYTVDRINSDVLEIVNEQRQCEKTFGFGKNLKLKIRLTSMQKKSRSVKAADYITIKPCEINKSSDEILELENITDPIKSKMSISSPKSIKSDEHSFISNENKNFFLNIGNKNNIVESIVEPTFDKLNCYSDDSVLSQGYNRCSENISDYPSRKSNLVENENQSDFKTTPSFGTNIDQQFSFDNYSSSIDHEISECSEQDLKPFDRLTTEEASIKVISLFELNSFDFSKIFADKIYILCGTGWKEGTKFKNFKRIDGKTIKNGIEIIHFRYSEHSSAHELEEFKNYNNYESIINTVNNKG